MFKHYSTVSLRPRAFLVNTHNGSIDIGVSRAQAWLATIPDSKLNKNAAHDCRWKCHRLNLKQQELCSHCTCANCHFKLIIPVPCGHVANEITAFVTDRLRTKTSFLFCIVWMIDKLDNSVATAGLLIFWWKNILYFAFVFLCSAVVAPPSIHLFADLAVRACDCSIHTRTCMWHKRAFTMPRPLCHPSDIYTTRRSINKF